MIKRYICNYLLCIGIRKYCLQLLKRPFSFGLQLTSHFSSHHVFYVTKLVFYNTHKALQHPWYGTYTNNNRTLLKVSRALGLVNFHCVMSGLEFVICSFGWNIHIDLGVYISVFSSALKILSDPSFLLIMSSFTVTNVYNPYFYKDTVWQVHVDFMLFAKGCIIINNN